MPFIDNTPESLLGRTDSLDPKTTCHGITSSGRPCRRPLTDSASSAPQIRRGKRTPTDLTDESLYCWQHKDQAARRTASSPGPRISASASGRRRSSIDTLTERLGLAAIDEGGGAQYGGGGGRQKKKWSTCTFCFCFTIPIPVLEDEEVDLPPRPKPRPIQSPGIAQHRPGAPSRAGLIPASVSPETAELLQAEIEKPVSAQDDPGYIYMFWLTPDTEPETPPKEAARSLLSPPSTPLADQQRRPSDVLAAFANTAFDIWGDSDNDSDGGSGVGSSSTRPRRTRNGPRDATREREMRVRGKKEGKKTILLKIGRATNVQRRLNEWKRQCGYNLSLIRYYPYIPSGSSGATPRKMPHSHKVERLIHIELAGAGLRVLDGDKCDACGREHREWFEVKATRSAIRDVDDVVKRWVDWDEGHA